MTTSSDATRRRFIAFWTGAAALGLTRPTFSRLEPGPQDAGAADSEITAATLAEAEKIAGITFTDAERELAAKGLGDNVARYRRRRTHALANGTGPASTFDPRLPGRTFDIEPRFRRSVEEVVALPTRDEDIAFAPVTRLSRWIERGQLTSERLTGIYLRRLRDVGRTLECVITLTDQLALAQARRADAEIRAGNYRGPLHGIPWGAKDLLDTKDLPTTWGATPYKDRVATRDATVVRRLEEAGAVLVAKLTLGALAYNDIWFGGRTRNPFDLSQGSSGSSAGSAAATAAGLVGFSIGTETLGSIVSPSMRCGTTGLRPTFGRVSRDGAMALCWSLDKIGPICRTVEDAATVLNAINGGDVADPCALDIPVNFDGTRTVRGLRIGYVPGWFDGRGANAIDKRVLSLIRELGMEPVEIELPDWPYDTLLSILMVEAAAAFEDLTLTDRDDELKWQVPQAWPNSFRETWFTPAIELMQATRFRRDVMTMMDEKFAEVDAMVGPSFAGSMLLITNNTGHPSVTLRAGFDQRGRPHGVTVWGRLFDEGTMCNVAMALEKALGVWDRRPTMKAAATDAGDD